MALASAGVVLLCDNPAILTSIHDALDAKHFFSLSVIDKIVSVIPPSMASDADVFVLISDNSPIATASAAHTIAEKYKRPVIIVAKLSLKSCFESNPSIDFLFYPGDSPTQPTFVNSLSTRIRLSYTRYVSSSGAPRKYTTPIPGTAPASERPPLVPPTVTKNFGNKLIAIGASAGGTEAIYNVLIELPAQMPGIVIVQHMPPSFTNMYAQRLNKACNLAVTEAINNEPVRPGVAYIAPGGLQMRVKKSGGSYAIDLYNGERVSGHAPSVDVMFDSVSQCAGGVALGVILTGMGSDGAQGLLKLRETGSHTIGQDEASCLVYGMPRAAFLCGAVAQQAPLSKIPELLIKYANS